MEAASTASVAPGAADVNPFFVKLFFALVVCVVIAALISPTSPASSVIPTQTNARSPYLSGSVTSAAVSHAPSQATQGLSTHTSTRSPYLSGSTLAPAQPEVAGVSAPTTLAPTYAHVPTTALTHAPVASVRSMVAAAPAPTTLALTAPTTVPTHAPVVSAQTTAAHAAAPTTLTPATVASVQTTVAPIAAPTVAPTQAHVVTVQTTAAHAAAPTTLAPTQAHVVTAQTTAAHAPAPTTLARATEPVPAPVRTTLASEVPAGRWDGEMYCVRDVCVKGPPNCFGARQNDCMNCGEAQEAYARRGWAWQSGPDGDLFCSMWPPAHARTPPPVPAPTPAPISTPARAPTPAPLQAPDARRACPDKCATYRHRNNSGVCKFYVSEWEWCGGDNPQDSDWMNYIRNNRGTSRLTDCTGC
jgi:hypothetical protein